MYLGKEVRGGCIYYRLYKSKRKQGVSKTRYIGYVSIEEIYKLIQKKKKRKK